MDQDTSFSSEDFDYPLPQERIARFSLPQRDASKLLVYRNGQISHRTFTHLPGELPTPSFLVFNNTRVIPARLIFHRTTGARVEVFMLEENADTSDRLAVNQKVWKCLVGNKKKWKETEELQAFAEVGKITYELRAAWADRENDLVCFTWSPPGTIFFEVISVMGLMPIPPYLNREASEEDRLAYQTVYAKIEGAVAAPTAGLHFTPAVLNQLEAEGVQSMEVTLHVGLGTFRPMKPGDIRQHEMHGEKVVITLENIQKLRAHLGHVVAVGTTSMRALESLYWLALKSMKSGRLHDVVEQQEPYQVAEYPLPDTVLDGLASLMQHNHITEIHFETRLFVMPGYKRQLVNGLITNFHQPKSTLLVLISTLVGDDWKRIYNSALQNDYRFLSYGDSSLLLP